MNSAWARLRSRAVAVSAAVAGLSPLAGSTRRGILLAAGELAIVAALAALPALFFWRILSASSGDAATFPQGDFTDLHYPYRRFVADELARGHLPVWNPYVSAGHPALGDIQFASLYPIGALFALWAGAGMPLLDLERQVVVHFALAGVFTYLLGRRLLRTRTGAVVTALAFTYGGYLTSFPIQQMIILQTSVWLPLILLFLDLAVSRRSPALAVPAGIALACAALAGHPQTLFYVLLGAVLYLLFLCWDRGLHLSEPVIAAVFLGVGLGLAAPQLIPAYQHLQLTSRGDATYPFTSSGFNFREMFGMIVPYWFGGQALYVGILPLVLVGLGLIHRVQGRSKAFWLLVGVLALLLSFGGNTFLQSIFYVALPPLKFRDHERLSFLVSLALAVLAGHGADSLLARHVDRETIGRYARYLGVVVAILSGVGVLFLYGSVTGYPDVRGPFGGLANHSLFTALLLVLSIGLLISRRRSNVSPTLLPPLLVLVAAIDLFSINWPRNLQMRTPDEVFPLNRTVAFLQSQAFGQLRISSEGLLPGDGNAGSAYRLQDIAGNSPLELESYLSFGQGVNEWQRWRLLNVRYVITKRDLGADGRFRLALRDGEVATYEVKPEYRLPRAWIAHRLVFAASDADALALTNTIDPAAEVVVEDEQIWLPEGQSPPASGPDAAADAAEVIEYSADRVVLQARLNRPGILVVSEVYHPDWAAQVDGTAARILKADGVLRGVLVAAGEHRVELTFESAGFARGLALARGVGLLAGLLVLGELALRAGAKLFPPAGRSVRRMSTRHSRLRPA